MTDPEFVAQRGTLQREIIRLQDKLRDPHIGTNPIEPLIGVISLSNRAADWFLQGDNQTKRLILEIVSSNLTLKGKILNIEAAKPFMPVSFSASNPRLLAIMNDVRTSQTSKKRWLEKLIKEMGKTLATEEGLELVDNIRKLKERVEPNDF